MSVSLTGRELADVVLAGLSLRMGWTGTIKATVTTVTQSDGQVTVIVERTEERKDDNGDRKQ